MVIKFNLMVADFRRSHLAKYGVGEAVLLAVISAMVGYFNLFLKIDMTESLEILFRECEGEGGDYEGLCQYVSSPAENCFHELTDFTETGPSGKWSTRCC